MTETSATPKVLNLDELELAESEIAVLHEGTKHVMRTLTVELFIEQQKRAAEHERMVAAGNFTSDDNDITDIVSLIRDAVLEFFPTLPVDKLETTKLFRIFGWLNDMSEKVNDTGAASVEEASSGEEDEGNVETVATDS